MDVYQLRSFTLSKCCASAFTYVTSFNTVCRSSSSFPLLLTHLLPKEVQHTSQNVRVWKGPLWVI